VCHSLLDLVSDDNPSDVSPNLSTESVSLEFSIPIAWHQNGTRLCPIVFECITTFVCLIASLSAMTPYKDDDRELTVDRIDKLCSALLDPRNV